MSQKLTPWYPGHIKPARPGPYQVMLFDGDDSGHYQFWSGKYWGHLARTPHRAYKLRQWRSVFQQNDWRGLAEKP